MKEHYTPTTEQVKEHYTPTTEQVKDLYHLGAIHVDEDGSEVDIEGTLAMFDRFISKLIADNFGRGYRHGYTNGYTKGTSEMVESE